MRIYDILLIVIILISISIPMGIGEESEKQNQSVLEITRGTYTYDFESRIVVINADDRGDPTVLLNDRSITAKQIIYNENENTLTAENKVRLWDNGSILEGDHLVYYIEKEEGTLKNVKDAEISKGIYFSGETLSFVRKAAKMPKGATEAVMQKEYTLTNGIMTACDLPVPHYTIKCKNIVLIPEERIWAHDLVLRSGDISLFYLPMFTQTLKEDVVTYFFNVNSYSHLGFGLFNRVMYKPNNNYIFNVYGDYYTRAGIGEGAKFDFTVPGEYGPKGELYGYHIYQEKSDNDSINTRQDRYLIAGNYEQDLPYDMRFTARGHEFSDSEYRYDYHAPERNKNIDVYGLERDVVSFLNLSKIWDSQSLRITAASRLDTFFYNGLPYVERKPEIHYEYYPSRILDSDFMLDFQLDYGRYRREEGVTYPLNQYTLLQQTQYIDDIERFDANFAVSRSFHLPQNFTLKPWLGYRGTFYTEAMRYADDPNKAGLLNERDFGSRNRNMLDGGLELYTRRILEFDSFLAHYQKMRAVFEPVIEYGYFRPDTALAELGLNSYDRFPYIDSIDEYRYQMHRISTILRTKIQGKDAAGNTSDFMRLGLGASYDRFPDDNLDFESFEFYDDPPKHRDERFADLIEEFSIIPATWLSFGNNLRYDVGDNVIRSSYYYSNIRALSTLNLSLGYYSYRYPFISHEQQQDFAFLMQWEMSKKWEFFLNSRYDLKENTFRYSRIGLIRDMHDFYTVFQVEHDSHPTLGDDYSFQVAVKLWGIGGRNGKSPEIF